MYKVVSVFSKFFFRMLGFGFQGLGLRVLGSGG